MSLDQVFHHPQRSQERLASLRELDHADIALAAIVIAEEHRQRPFIDRSGLGLELGQVVLAANLASITHHVVNVAIEYGIVGHLAVQYASLVTPKGTSFSDAIRHVSDEHLSIILAAYAAWKVEFDSEWKGPHEWSSDSMISLLPFLDDPRLLLKLVRSMRMKLASFALRRYAEVVELEDLEAIMEPSGFLVNDSAWTEVASKMRPPARERIAFLSDCSFIKREAMQRTLPTELLLAKLPTVEDNVRRSIERVLEER